MPGHARKDICAKAIGVYLVVRWSPSFGGEDPNRTEIRAPRTGFRGWCTGLGIAIDVANYTILSNSQHMIAARA